eukprot:COSAG04_NODE_1938_length_5175_cov_178.678093_8_plen_93_part_00
MKRHGFKGGPASHGSSKFHRKVRPPLSLSANRASRHSPARWMQGGSIGQTGMGRVHKGQKMAGRMGAEKVTVFNLQVRSSSEHPLPLHPAVM